MRRSIGLAAGLLSLVSAPGLAQERPVGAVFYACNDVVRFSLPGRDGKPALFKDASRPRVPPAALPPEVDSESIEAGAEVEPDGAVGKLTMAWMQKGIGGWPYFVRADLDDVYIYVGFGGVFPLHERHKLPPQARFDPEKLFVEIDWLQVKKIKRPIMLELSNGPARAGGLATIGRWRKGAEIGMWWRELRDLAGGKSTVDFEVSDLAMGDHGLERTVLQRSVIDLSVMPAVIARFEEAERRIRAKAKKRETECIRRVVEEPVDISGQDIVVQ